MIHSIPAVEAKKNKQHGHLLDEESDTGTLDTDIISERSSDESPATSDDGIVIYMFLFLIICSQNFFYF